MKNRIMLTAALAFVMSMLISAVVPSKSPQDDYIRKYAPVAVREMYRSGVPASITLAQGLLESRYGQSDLAVKGNNHFGIKCHDWTGKKMYHDDDRRGECFRVYGTADESFSDHSDFLRYRDRYKSLFNNDVTDYKAWAHGLKKAGYATDPAYPSKLIKLIEDYHLDKYDTMRPEDFGEKVRPDEKELRNTIHTRLTRKQKREAKRAEKAEKVTKTDKTEKQVPIPEPPLSIEEPERVTAEKASETFSFSLVRQMYKTNGVPFVYSQEGESYASIANDYHLFLREILRFNDAVSDKRLEPGTTVYLQSKKSQTKRGLDKYISDEGGETLYELSQRFGVKLKDLCKMNDLARDYVTKPGDELDLRPSRR